MTQDEIIELAMNSGLPSKEAAQHQLWWLEAFAKLVEERTAAKERERIIAMEKDLAASPALFATMKEWSGYKHGIETFIAAIRARGETTLRGEA